MTKQTTNTHTSHRSEPVPPLVPEFLSENTSCMLVKIGQVALRLVDQRLEPLGLRTRHHSMLATIIEDGPMSQQDLARQLRIDKATMTASIAHLEKHGLVERSRDETDRKRYALKGTPKGRRIAENAMLRLERLDAELLADLDIATRESLHETAKAINVGPALGSLFDESRP